MLTKQIIIQYDTMHVAHEIEINDLEVCMFTAPTPPNIQTMEI